MSSTVSEMGHLAKGSIYSKHMTNGGGINRLLQVVLYTVE